MTAAIAVGSPRMAAQPKGAGRTSAFSAGRGAALIGGAIVVGLILLKVVDEPSASGGGGGGGGGQSPVTATTPASISGDVRDPSEVRVIVLNASGVGGAAANKTNALRTAGYNMLTPADAPQRQGTAVQCQEGYENEANVLLLALVEDGATVEPYETPPAGLGAEEANCVVYLGTPSG